MFLSRELVKYGEYLKARGYAQETIKGYGHNLKRFRAYVQSIGLKGINEINREVIFNYQLYLSSHQPMLTINVRTRCIVALKSFMRYLVKSHQVMVNFAADVEIPKQKKLLPKGIMSFKEVKRLLKQPDTNTRLGKRDRAILELLYACGLRNKELRSLKINDVNFEENIVYVNDGKGGKDRIVPFGKVAYRYLEQYIQKSRPTFLLDSAEQILFMGYGKRPISAEAVSDLVKKYVKQSGIRKKVTPHSIRHTFATHMLKRRASLRHIQILLGHKSLQTTQKYTHVEISDLKRAYQKYHPRARE